MPEGRGHAYHSLFDHCLDDQMLSWRFSINWCFYHSMAVWKSGVSFCISSFGFLPKDVVTCAPETDVCTENADCIVNNKREKCSCSRASSGNLTACGVRKSTLNKGEDMSWNYKTCLLTPLCCYMFWNFVVSGVSGIAGMDVSGMSLSIPPPPPSLSLFQIYETVVSPCTPSLLPPFPLSLSQTSLSQ